MSITELSNNLLTKITIFIIIIAALFSISIYLVFVDELNIDDPQDNSFSSNVNAVNEDANVRIELAIETQPATSNHTDSTETSQSFNYGECFFPDPEVEKELGEKRDNYLETLGKSSIKDDKIAYTIFGNMVYAQPSELEQENRLKIDALMDLDLIEEPLIALELMHTCTIYAKSEHCNNKLFAEITSQHRDDSEVWLRALGYYLKTGQADLVFNAIEQLKQSKYSSSYSHLFIDAYTQLMEKGGIDNYPSSVMSALLYFNTTKLPSYYAESNAWCNDNLDKDGHVQSCLDMATMLEQKSHDVFSKMVGLAFQDNVYSKEGNTDLVKIVKQREEALQPKYLSDDWKKLIDVSTTVFQYEKLLRAYIANTAVLGERGAFKPIEDEVMAFRASDQYVDCGGF